MSERKDPRVLPLAVRALSEEEQSELLRTLLQSTDYGVLVTDPHGEDLIANRRFGELFGLDPQEIVQLSWKQVRRKVLKHLRDPRGFARRIEEIYGKPDLTTEDEIELILPERRILRRHTAPLKSSRGENVGRIWTFLDVTETRDLQADLEQAAAALQDQVAQRTADLRTTTEVLQAMAQIVRAISSAPDIPLLIAEIASRVRHLFGHRCAAVLLREAKAEVLVGALAQMEPVVSCPVRIGREEDPLLWERLETAAAASPRLQLLHENVPTVIGAMGCPIASMVPLAIRGEIEGVLLWGADQMPERQNRFLREQIEAVAGLVALAIETHELQAELQRAYRELRDAQDQLVEAEKLSTAGMLATSIAHDIRNIITPLNVELSLLSETSEDEALRAAREQVSRLAVLTQRLMAFARHSQLQRESVAVREMLDRLQFLLATQAELERVAVRVEDRAGGARLVADVARLEQLFLNLAFNAFQAMAPNGGVLTIRAERESDRLAIRFLDTGRGIPAEDLPSLFQAFFTTKPSGTGLGLFSCQRIAADHSGHVEAANRPEGGACFTVWLPVERSDE